MTRRGNRRTAIVFALVAAAIAAAVLPGRAHKPITSPYTYNEDVFPILRDRCSRCHVTGGVAPMSLLTHADTVPWGESIRVELLAGHMPPWTVDAAPGRFHNVSGMTAREMNILLTWATGGTPLGDPEKTPPPSVLNKDWPLGPPDLALPFPREFTLPASSQEDTTDFVIPTGTSERRWLRAVDLLPGSPSIVRAATVQLRSPVAPPASAVGDEPLLAIWLPGDEPVMLDDAGFELPAGAELLVRVRYKKTWQFEREEMKDRSTVGLYFARGPTPPVRAIALESRAAPATAGVRSGMTFGRRVEEDVRVLSLYPNDTLAGSGVVLTAVAPDRSRTELIAFHPRAGWTRRYWFREPVPLARGTQLEARVAFDDEAPLLPLLAAPARSPLQDESTIRLTLNVVSSR
jgi:hypothetical protein